MNRLDPIHDNVRFLVREVTRQLERARDYASSPSTKLREQMEARDNYIDNLKGFIQSGCFKVSAELPERVEELRALDAIASNLERISDFCIDVVGQLSYVDPDDRPEPEAFEPYFAEVEKAMGMVEKAIIERDVHVATRVCRVEPKLDELYREAFHKEVARLESGARAHTRVTMLFVWHYFERMGDALLNVGEAVISASLGERVKIGQLWALEEALADMPRQWSVDELELRGVGESRSGCRIARVTRESEKGTRSVLFKEGQIDKIREEKRGIELWEELAPGRAPAILSFHEQEDTGAILLEFLPGRTFEEILLQEELPVVLQGLTAITDTLEDVWSKTLVRESRPIGFLEQLDRRYPDILAVHPWLKGSTQRIGDLGIPSFEDLLDAVRPLAETLEAPFAVLGHGDMNLDNIVVSMDTGGVRVFDLHRAALTDYLQDGSVFMVSNSRLQIFEEAVRARINEVVRTFYGFLCDFGRRNGDTTAPVRLAFGLARSYATSARFVLDKKFARRLFQRARFLLTSLAELDPADASNYEIPEEILSE